MSIPTFADILQAVDRLRDVALITPVVTAAELDARAQATVFLKCEQRQRTGSFKFRGAYNAVASLLPDTAGKPLVTVSSGNHGQALALAARLHDRRVSVVAPGAISEVKRAAILAQGGAIIEAPTRDAAEREARAWVERGEAILVHPFNDRQVIAGQGTCAVELLAHVLDLDVVLAPVGGGGLLSGTCVAAHGLNPDIRIYACEPVGALDAYYSVREHRVVPMLAPNTMADGLRSSLGPLTLEILHQHLAGFFTVEEREIEDALRFALERLSLVIEPSSAVALAPLLRGEPVLRGKRVGVILTGGNVRVDPRGSWPEAPTPGP